MTANEARCGLWSPVCGECETCPTAPPVTPAEPFKEPVVPWTARGCSSSEAVSDADSGPESSVPVAAHPETGR